jgi:DNA repair and recombination RAD54-like protein
MTPKSMVLPRFSRPSSDVKHVLGCSKIQKWNSHPNVLAMGYSSFLALMRRYKI